MARWAPSADLGPNGIIAGKGNDLMTRQELHQLVDDVPENALPHLGEILGDILDEDSTPDQAWDDPEFVAYVTERIRLAEESLARGEFVTMDEAKKRFAKWLKR